MDSMAKIIALTHIHGDLLLPTIISTSIGYGIIRMYDALIASKFQVSLYDEIHYREFVFWLASTTQVDNHLPLSKVN